MIGEIKIVNYCKVTYYDGVDNGIDCVKYYAQDVQKFWKHCGVTATVDSKIKSIIASSDTTCEITFDIITTVIAENHFTAALLANVITHAIEMEDINTDYLSDIAIINTNIYE